VAADEVAVGPLRAEELVEAVGLGDDRAGSDPKIGIKVVFGREGRARTRTISRTATPRSVVRDRLSWLLAKHSVHHRHRPIPVLLLRGELLLP
jgi:hypothetical protein